MILQTNFPIKSANIYKIDKKNSISINVFGYENKEKYPIFFLIQCCEEKHAELLLMGEGEKHILFLSNISIDSCVNIYYIVEKSIFVLIAYLLSLQKKILKGNFKDCFKTYGKQTIKIPKTDEYVKFENFGIKIQSSFMIYAVFEIIPVSSDNVKQNPDESYTDKYQKHVACSYVYKWLSVDE